MMDKIKEAIRSGKKPKKAIADALAEMAMEKKMAHGGMVDDASDPLSEEVEAAGLPKDESMAEMASKGPDDGIRGILEIQEDGESHPDEVANPAMMAKALRNFAMGGLVEGKSDTDVGNKPMRKDMSAETSEPMGDMPKKPSNMEHSGLTEEAMEAIRNKRKSRRFV